MENKEQHEELRNYKNRAWQAEAKLITLCKVIVALLVIVLFFCVRAGSYRIALIVSGTRLTYVLTAGVSDAPRPDCIAVRNHFMWRLQNSRFSHWIGRNNEYHIIFSHRPGDDVSFVRMRRNRLGFWFARDISRLHPISGGVMAASAGRHSIGWCMNTWIPVLAGTAICFISIPTQLLQFI